MDTRLYWIWMQLALTPGSPKTDPLLRRFGGAREVYEAGLATLLNEGRESGDYSLTPGEQERLKGTPLSAAQTVLKQATADGGWLLTPEDKLFPSLLKAIPGLPLVLYGRGDMPNLDLLPSIAVVGTRETTAYGRRVTALLAGGLALGGAVVISGGARGVDAIAHEAALAAGGLTVAVQACGLDVNYPRQNEELRQKIGRCGAVVSEFPPGTAALRHHFSIRNRLISGMALGTCVTEAPEQSGALITARHAFEQGRDVFAVAGDMLSGRSPGTDTLIRQGARLITGAQDILEEYEFRFSGILDPKAAAGVRTDARFRTDRLELLAGPEKAPKPVPSLITDDGLHDRPAAKLAEPTPALYAVCPEPVSEDARTVFEPLKNGPQRIGALAQLTGLPAPRVMTALTELEIAGCVRCLPGQVYTLV